MKTGFSVFPEECKTNIFFFTIVLVKLKKM